MNIAIEVEEVNNNEVARNLDCLEISNAHCLHHVLADPK